MHSGSELTLQNFPIVFIHHNIPRLLGLVSVLETRKRICSGKAIHSRMRFKSHCNFTAASFEWTDIVENFARKCWRYNQKDFCMPEAALPYQWTQTHNHLSNRDYRVLRTKNEFLVSFPIVNPRLTKKWGMKKYYCLLVRDPRIEGASGIIGRSVLVFPRSSLLTEASSNSFRSAAIISSIIAMSFRLLLQLFFRE